jgi:hypothetical protein
MRVSMRLYIRASGRRLGEACSRVCRWPAWPGTDPTCANAISCTAAASRTADAMLNLVTLNIPLPTSIFLMDWF